MEFATDATGATGATDATDATEVVQKWWLSPHLPRTPGARMTVVTQTPSNHHNAKPLVVKVALRQ